MRTTVGLLAALSLSLATYSVAHPLEFTDTSLIIRAGHFQVDVIADLDALALGVRQDADDAELVAAIEQLSPADRARLLERLTQVFVRRVRIRFDGRPAPFEVSFPDYGTQRASEAEIPTVIGLTARLQGIIPGGADTVEFFASRAFSDVHLTIVDETRGVTHREVLEPGARSDPFELVRPVTPPGGAAVAARYLRLGFTHIVPDGLDHVLFVLGLFLLSPRLGPLLWQVSAFTLAHALTLALGALDVVAMSPAVVEPLIALSISWIALENIIMHKRASLSLWRPAIVFAFGLLHGLGFASVLGELGLPAGERALALLSFNGGIEVGQIAVIAAALLTFGWFRQRVWYRRYITVPMSAAIAVIGLAWTVERVLS